MSTLADPLALPCGAVLPNRIAKAAMTEGMADPLGRATPELARLYGRWSDGGAGLLITGNVQVDGNHLERPGNMIVSGRQDSEAMARLKALASAGTRGGNHFWMQISHGGRQTQAVVNPHPKAPSAVAIGLPGKLYGVPEPLTEREILDLIERFGVAAEVAQSAGFTGVQIHGAHGYLLSQFLSPRSNLRDDAWGGSLENRARMLMEVFARVRRGVGPKFPIGVKLNSADFQKGGFGTEDSIVVAGWLQAAGVDLLEVSGGSLEQPAMMNIDGLEPREIPPQRPSTLVREAYFLDFARTMRRSVTVPMMVTGGFRTRAAMNAALEQGGADVIGIGRPFCADPDVPAKLLAGTDRLERWEERLSLAPRGLGFLRRFSLFHVIESFAVTCWYYAQMDRIGRTGYPDIGITPFSAFRQVSRHSSAWIKARKAGKPSIRQGQVPASSLTRKALRGGV
ncbi:MAG: NADH:flavin oxidoreductase/NADH oxidase family protein [Parvibaculum sp.]|uniref:NADH:flavin oxidoreductase/NADH oxidase family protein n=1 Tax=Parvibaculum sp. TaxID=2024848 RepID=UPI0028490B73|nr:NADH:flavin oxidoreductase/NADH oxidase family protein [Parvibaculum sp.]MDR3500149.1 NADH:flavin oxidoreductase/NADH oxidase family protein [Parvibaculum sp.]